MAELVSILDRLNELPDDAIAELASPRDRQEALRNTLAGLQAEDLEAVKQEWDGQAGAKVPEDDGDISGTIPSPSDLGFGG